MDELFVAVAPDVVVMATPVQDHRGHLAECLYSWVYQEDIDPDRYELIVLSDGSDQAIEALARD